MVVGVVFQVKIGSKDNVDMVRAEKGAELSDVEVAVKVQALQQKLKRERDFPVEIKEDTQTQQQFASFLLDIRDVKQRNKEGTNVGLFNTYETQSYLERRLKAILEKIEVKSEGWSRMVRKIDMKTKKMSLNNIEDLCATDEPMSFRSESSEGEDDTISSARQKKVLRYKKLKFVEIQCVTSELQKQRRNI